MRGSVNSARPAEDCVPKGIVRNGAAIRADPNVTGNFLSERVHRSTLSGVTVTAIESSIGAGPAWHKFPAGGAILSVVLQETKGRCEARTDVRKATAIARPSNVGHLSIIPSDAEIWGYSERVETVSEARFFFDEAIAGEEFGERLDLIFRVPQLMKADQQIHDLSRLLAQQAQRGDGERMFSEGLLAALLARLAVLRSETSTPSRSYGLTPGQLRNVTDYIAAKATENIGLSELTALVGLSRSQFGRAFKASTGVSPHRWHREERVKVAKALLRETDCSLVDIALTAGFSEQSHFNRVFRSLTGTTPKAWRRGH